MLRICCRCVKFIEVGLSIVEWDKRGAKQSRELGERVRARRLKLKLSQEDLGDRSGLHRTYIGHLERGEVNPSLLNILKVAAAL
jgi:DNA-binding XRE family transcriptional regulator